MCLLMSLSNLVFKIAYKPLTSFKLNFVLIVNQTFYAVIDLIFFILVEGDSTISLVNKYNYLGYPLIVAVAGLMLFNIGMAFIETIKSIIEWCKARRAKKEQEMKVHQEELENVDKIKQEGLKEQEGEAYENDFMNLSEKNQEKAKEMHKLK